MMQPGRVFIPAVVLILGLCQAESAFAKDRIIVDRRQKGYRLRASTAWKVEKAPGGADSMISLTDSTCSINVARVPASSINEITATHLQTVYRKSETKYVSRTFVKQKVETHRGKPSGWFELTGELQHAPGLLFHFRQYFTLHRGYLYVITIVAPDDFWEKTKPKWKKVVESMEFL